MNEWRPQPPVLIYFILQHYTDKASLRRDPCKWWHLWKFCELVYDKQEKPQCYTSTKDSMTESSWQCRHMPLRAASSLPNWEGSTCSRSHTATEVKARERRPRKSPLTAGHKQSQLLSVIRISLGKHMGKAVCHWKLQCTYITLVTYSSLCFLTVSDPTCKAETLSPRRDTGGGCLSPWLRQQISAVTWFLPATSATCKTMHLPAHLYLDWEQNNSGSSSVFAVSDGRPVVLKEKKKSYFSLLV